MEQLIEKVERLFRGESVWFKDEEEIRQKYWSIKNGDIVYDIGCHIGSYSIPALLAGATVYAIDPNEGFINCLRSIAGPTDKLITINTALSEKGGYTEDFRSKLDKVDNYYLHAHPSSNFISLDELVEVNKMPRPNWIKIDVEGAELSVLKGGENTIRTFRPRMIIEDHTKVYKFVAEMGSASRCYKFLIDVGYEVRLVNYNIEPKRDFWICS